MASASTDATMQIPTLKIPQQSKKVMIAEDDRDTEVSMRHSKTAPAGSSNPSSRRFKPPERQFSKQFGAIDTDDSRVRLHTSEDASSTDRASQIHAKGIAAQQYAQYECQERLSELLDFGSLDNVEEEYEFLYEYKASDCFLHGQLLHFAVGQVAGHVKGPLPPAADRMECLKALLEAQADVDSNASYKNIMPGREKQCAYELHAIHIAAAKGSVEAMDMLANFVEETQGGPEAVCTMVNKMCKRSLGGDQMVDFYPPILEAAFAGHVKAIIWFLEKGARPQVTNADGKNILHILANIPQSDEVLLRDGIWTLVEKKAELERRTNPGIFPPSFANKTPLEIATLSGSAFPGSLLYLLAPSFHGLGDFFDDIRVLSDYTTNAAESLAKEASNQARYRQNVRLSAQSSLTTVGALAELLFKAPKAAASVLDILVDDPKIEDQHKHGIEKRSDLGGDVNLGNLRAAYEPDNKMKDFLRWPTWECGSWAGGRGGKPWHRDFIPADEHTDTRQKVVDIRVRVVLLPNILDMDMLQAFARVGQKDSSIFGKPVVQGIISCLWPRFIHRVFYIHLTLRLLTLCVLLRWGTWNRPGDQPDNLSHQEISQYGKQMVPAFQTAVPWCWCFVLSAAIRECVLLLCGRHELIAKQEAAKSIGAGRSRGQLVWSSPGTSTLLFFDICSVVLMFSLSLHMLLCNSDDDQVHYLSVESDIGVFLLAACVLFAFINIIEMLQVVPGFGGRLIAVLSTLGGGQMTQMFLVTLIVLLSIVAFFVVFVRYRDASTLAIMVVRGLMFGDGNGLDTMGLLTTQSLLQDENGEDVSAETNFHQAVMAWVGGFVNLMFNVTILNLIIAVYSAAYVDNKWQGDFLFFRQQAHYTVKSLLTFKGLHYKVMELRKVKPRQLFYRLLEMLPGDMNDWFSDNMPAAVRWSRTDDADDGEEVATEEPEPAVHGALSGAFKCVRDMHTAIKDGSKDKFWNLSCLFLLATACLPLVNLSSAPFLIISAVLIACAQLIFMADAMGEAEVIWQQSERVQRVNSAAAQEQAADAQEVPDSPGRPPLTERSDVPMIRREDTDQVTEDLGLEDNFLWIAHRADYDEEWFASRGAEKTDLKQMQNIFSSDLKHTQENILAEVQSLGKRISDLEERSSQQAIVGSDDRKPRDRGFSVFSMGSTPSVGSRR